MTYRTAFARVTVEAEHRMCSFWNEVGISLWQEWQHSHQCSFWDNSYMEVCCLGKWRWWTEENKGGGGGGWKSNSMWKKHYFKSWRCYFNKEMDSNQYLGSEYFLNFLEAQVWTSEANLYNKLSCIPDFLHSWALQKSRFQLCGLGGFMNIVLLKYFMCMYRNTHPFILLHVQM